MFVLALAAACSGPKRSDDSTPPEQVAPAPAGSATDVNPDAGVVPAPPPEGSQPSDIPHGTSALRRAEASRIAQLPSDAGAPGARDAGAPMRDAAAPSPARDAGLRDAAGGLPIDAGGPAPGAPPTSPR